jgi:hypothetical protein
MHRWQAYGAIDPVKDSGHWTFHNFQCGTMSSKLKKLLVYYKNHKTKGVKSKHSMFLSTLLVGRRQGNARDQSGNVTGQCSHGHSELPLSFCPVGVLEEPQFDIPDYYTLGDMMICVPYVIQWCQKDTEGYGGESEGDGSLS